ncbi:bacteriophage antitermination protein Q [Dickeya fangzhongdai]|uniref:bacteriophage antitermination protein Q n=1 Tax=Dickeya fangzhongdai TaxID=1778540 RepID=UPI0004F85F42|nr:bacteriophage antitermination protein Q [Dickeya fangzhongdai]AIR71458.1 antiterminator [Dickeya fangzhongdai]KGT98488.1 antiterminator [Dickeya fangzhongdai]
MNNQFLQYVREEIMLATADFSGRTKGQLVALVEQLQYTNDRYPRKRQFVIDPETEKKVMLKNPPIPGKQSHAKGHAIPLLIPVEYATASWRRAIGVIDEHHNAWLRWNYAGDTDFQLQTIIVRFGWGEFSEGIKGRRIAKKTRERLRALIWLAAQDVKFQLAGRNGDVYQHADLAALAGVSKSTWSETYQPHWLSMTRIFTELDRAALISVSKTRSQQKSTNCKSCVAKPN